MIERRAPSRRKATEADHSPAPMTSPPEFLGAGTVQFPGHRIDSIPILDQTTVQAKLEVGPVDDPAEAEADAIADEVVGGAKTYRPTDAHQASIRGRKYGRPHARRFR